MAKLFVIAICHKLCLKLFSSTKHLFPFNTLFCCRYDHFVLYSVQYLLKKQWIIMNEKIKNSNHGLILTMNNLLHSKLTAYCIKNHTY